MIIVKDYTLLQYDKNMLEIIATNDEAKKELSKSFKHRISKDEFFQSILSYINKKDNIISVSFRRKKFYIVYILFNNDDYKIIIKRYKMVGIFEYKKFIQIMNILSERYDEVSEKTLFNISEKLKEVSLNKWIPENIISILENYSFSRNANEISNKEVVIKIIEYINNNKNIIIKELEKVNFNTNTSYKIIACIINLWFEFRYPFLIFSIIEIFINFSFLFVIGFLGLDALLVNFAKKYKVMKLSEIIDEFLEDLQNSLNIDESDDQLSLEGVKKLEGTKQRVLLEEKVKLQGEENLFSFNNRFKEENIDRPVYESGPKLNFGYKEE